MKALTVVSASEAPAVGARRATAGPAADRTGALAADNAGPSTGFDPARLQSALDAVHRAGMPGVHVEVRDGGRVWSGASGVADVVTGRPVTPDMRHRVGSVTKTFTAAATLQQVERGRIRLDAPIGDYLPQLVPAEPGRTVTVRMLLNHTSGIAHFLPYAFPSLHGPDVSAKSLDDNRFRRFAPTDLIEMGLSAPATGEPGTVPGAYSNTNYLILGQLLQQVTGMTAEEYITRNVIERAGLRHTVFPDGPEIDGPHPRMYEALQGLIDPPRDYSVYDTSWVGPSASLVSTTEDLNLFYSSLLSGRIVGRRSLSEMQRTVPVQAFRSDEMINYGLGLHRVEMPGCGTFWGHDGTMWGAGTMSLTSADGTRQMSVAMNLVRWNKPASFGKPQRHRIDDALSTLYRQALCGDRNA